MDLIKAQRLLVKIQAFLDNAPGKEISRLEKDLIKSYIQQLYEAISEEEKQVPAEVVKPPEVQLPKVQKFEPVHIPVEESRPETVKQPLTWETPVKMEVPEPQVVAMPVDIPVPLPKVEPMPIKEEVKEHVVTALKVTPERQEAGALADTLKKLFEAATADDSRFGHVPVSNIEAALGINDRIFTLNGLFEGDKPMFDATCAALNDLRSFTEATELLIHGPASRYNWTDPEKVKMAEHFIRIVYRRYPKS